MANLASSMSTRPALSPTPPPLEASLRSRVFSLWFALPLGGALAWAVFQATRSAWTSDDAYISFRYAANWIDGLGLVYNAGERVEGYSNFLWTLWCALGLKLGFTAEAWSQAWGIVCYAITLILLGGFTARRVTRVPAFPVAAFLGAFHPEWNRYATSGLETSAFTMLATAGYVLTVVGRGWRSGAAAGAALGLGALTRPDGVLFAVAAGVYMLLQRPFGWRRLVVYAGVLTAIGLPYALWKLDYYGDLLPNTFYAKSGNVTWLEQGLVYVMLYFQRYWVVLAGLPLAAWAWISARRSGRPLDADWSGAAALAAAFALLYIAYVVKVGGDFMFARFLIPVTPFLLILLELGLERLDLRRAVARPAITAGLATAMMVTPTPVVGGTWYHGIADEWSFYQERDREAERVAGQELGRVFDGLPVRIAFGGSQAIHMYYSRVPVAIEASTGLTDSFVAHQRLTRRGRVGHEKTAPFPYLIERRQAHMQIFFYPGVRESLFAYVPVIPIHFQGLTGYLLRWDPDVLHSLKERGVRFRDFPTLLDEYIETMPELSDDWVADDYARFRRFYFDHVTDPVREEPFTTRLGRSASAIP